MRKNGEEKRQKMRGRRKASSGLPLNNNKSHPFTSRVIFLPATALPADSDLERGAFYKVVNFLLWKDCSEEGFGAGVGG